LGEKLNVFQETQLFFVCDFFRTVSEQLELISYDKFSVFSAFLNVPTPFELE